MREERIVIGGHELVLARPDDPESLIDESRFEEDEFLPYWAELWPSGIALARYVAALDLAGSRVLELGCGLALPSFAAALAGADVLATDWAPEALELVDGERGGEPPAGRDRAPRLARRSTAVHTVRRGSRGDRGTGERPSISFWPRTFSTRSEMPCPFSPCSTAAVSRRRHRSRR